MNLNPEQTFNFFPVPTDIHFGPGVLQALPARVNSFGAQKAFLVTDPGLRAAGILDKVVTLLQTSGIQVDVCDRVKPDSGSQLIDCTTAELKQSGAGVVIGIGGGSSLDTAKAVAALATNPGSCLDYVGLNKLRNKPLPTIAIPTTAGTGSEVTLWSVFTDDTKGLKVAIGGFLIYPAVALCDPELTIDLPAQLTASTGMDALAHAIECYTNTVCQPISGALALEAVRLIGKHLRTAVLSGRNREARYGMMLASTMAGIAMNPTRLGLAHALAMPLGSWNLHVPHGVILAMLLPMAMEFNYLAAPDRFVDVAEAMGEPVDNLSRLEAARYAVESVRALARDIGIPTSMSAYGLCEDHIKPVVEEAMKSGNIPVNPRRTVASDLEQMLRKLL
jgi:alcohol dehydrogenase